jgi:hypothetical protein
MRSISTDANIANWKFLNENLVGEFSMNVFIWVTTNVRLMV